MSKVIDFNKRKDRHVLNRKDARAEALRQRFEAVREDVVQQDPQQKVKATKRLLDLFKNPPDKKR